MPSQARPRYPGIGIQTSCSVRILLHAEPVHVSGVCFALSRAGFLRSDILYEPGSIVANDERQTGNNMRLIFVAVAVVLTSSLSFAQGHHHQGGAHRGKHAPSSQEQSVRRNRAEGSGDATTPHAPAKRINGARAEFMRSSGFPDGRPGYVIAYLVPLRKGGEDSASNMEWKLKEDPKAKAPKSEKPPRAPKPKRAGERPRHHRRA